MLESKLTWDEIASLISNLALQIKKKKKKYDWIVSLNRGGLIPGVRMSHILGARHAVLSIESYTRMGKKKPLIADNGISMIGEFRKRDTILIVDDIADSGESLAFALHRVRASCPEVKAIDTATIHYKARSVVEPTFFAEKINDDIWITFPWESLQETTKKKRNSNQ